MAQSLESARNKDAHLASLDDDQFMKEWQEVSDRAQRDRELLVMYNQENQRREDAKRLARAMDLSEEQARKVLAATAEGIKSEEAVGSNG